MFNSFNVAKAEVQIRLCAARIKLQKNKHTIASKAMRKSVSELLIDKPGHAAIRVEGVIREKLLLQAYEILELYLELLAVRAQLISKSKEMPRDMVEAISSIIYASQRVSEVPELNSLRLMFISKYGKEYGAEASSDMNCNKWQVNQTLIRCLLVEPPQGEDKFEMLKDIAEEFGVEKWDSDKARMELISSGAQRSVPNPGIPSMPLQSSSTSQVSGPWTPPDQLPVYVPPVYTAPVYVPPPAPQPTPSPQPPPQPERNLGDANPPPNRMPGAKNVGMNGMVFTDPLAAAAAAAAAASHARAMAEYAAQLAVHHTVNSGARPPMPDPGPPPQGWMQQDLPDPARSPQRKMRISWGGGDGTGWNSPGTSQGGSAPGGSSSGQPHVRTNEELQRAYDEAPGGPPDKSHYTSTAPPMPMAPQGPPAEPPRAPTVMHPDIGNLPKPPTGLIPPPTAEDDLEEMNRRLEALKRS